MAPKNRVIIDTDPGNDDVLALLVALAAPATELEVPLISVTFGNVGVEQCLRNVVALFHTIDREVEWRKSQNLPVGFEGVTKFKPLVAVGAAEPLQDKIESADFFHGVDGLGGSSETHPHLFPKYTDPQESWRKLFEKPPANDDLSKTASRTPNIKTPTVSFAASREPAHKEILRVLRESEPDTITLVAIGPLTNFALAAAEDPETFLRAKELVAMGGTVEGIGNVTPVAEFNVYADPHAAARVYALSSHVPSSTMPPVPAEPPLPGHAVLPPYPAELSRTLHLTLMSLDITEFHGLSRGDFTKKSKKLAERGSPLAQWMSAFLTPTLDKMERLHIGHEGDTAFVALHDPMCIWYVLTREDPLWKPSVTSPEDIRIETVGQWTRGMTVGDRRDRKRRNSDGERPHDRGNWLGNQSGNRVFRMLGSPGRDTAGMWVLDRIFGPS